MENPEGYDYGGCFHCGRVVLRPLMATEAFVMSLDPEPEDFRLYFQVQEPASGAGLTWVGAIGVCRDCFKRVGAG
ncbi:MAG: hypothetical protein HY329_09125 [Chloroflexi bacterium]|nr:hypothetical protein [Chloroflexota bacterium]